MSELIIEDFEEMAEFIKQRDGDTLKTQQINSAFIGWQLGAGGKNSFNAYLKRLNIIEPKDEELSKNQKRYYEKKADKIAADLSKVKKWRKG